MSEQGFSKSNRLLNSKDFSYLKSRSQTVKGRWLRAYFKEGRLNGQETRVGFAISKKVGKACKRNRLKRIMKETFRTSPHRLLSKDILFVVSPYLLKNHSSLEEAEKSLLKDFNRFLNEIRETA